MHIMLKACVVLLMDILHKSTMFLFSLVLLLPQGLCFCEERILLEGWRISLLLVQLVRTLTKVCSEFSVSFTTLLISYYLLVFIGAWLYMFLVIIPYQVLNLRFN